MDSKSPPKADNWAFYQELTEEQQVYMSVHMGRRAGCSEHRRIQVGKDLQGEENGQPGLAVRRRRTENT